MTSTLTKTFVHKYYIMLLILTCIITGLSLYCTSLHNMGNESYDIINKCGHFVDTCERTDKYPPNPYLNFFFLIPQTCMLESKKLLKFFKLFSKALLSSYLHMNGTNHRYMHVHGLRSEFSFSILLPYLRRAVVTSQIICDVTCAHDDKKTSAS